MKLFFLVVACCLNTFLTLAVIGVTVYGLVLAFKASIAIGIVALMLEPSPAIIGLVALFGHVDLAQKVAHSLGLT